MKYSKEKQIVSELLLQADIEINGKRDWDIQILCDSVYGRVLSQGSLGLGETYVEGLWECKALDQLFFKMMRADLNTKVKYNLPLILHFVKNKLFNLQTQKEVFDLKHYDIGNKLYSKMLGATMGYTCGYWKTAKNIDDAQIAKFELICKKIGLQKGMRILDIGCGWGSFMKYAVENYGVSCVGITISPSQIELGKKICQGLPIEFIFQDYRELNGTYDRIVSIGMLEAVGNKNYREYMKVVSKNLTDDGIFLLHTIGAKSSKIIDSSDPWLDKYIFPNGQLPGAKQICEAIDNIFIIEDWHNFGADYDKTLLAWFSKFEESWPEIKNDYDEKFYRMWKYYLLSCAGLFRARATQLWQIVLTKNGVVGGYESIR